MLHDDSVWFDAPTFNPEPTDWLDTDTPDDDRYDGCAVFSEYFPENGGSWTAPWEQPLAASTASLWAFLPTLLGVGDRS